MLNPTDDKLSDDTCPNGWKYFQYDGPAKTVNDLKPNKETGYVCYGKNPGK